MRRITFREFVSRRDEDMAPPPPMQTPIASPMNKQKIVQTLQTAQNAPAPPASNPTKYRTNLLAATNVAKSTNVTSPEQAMDIAKVQSKASH
jgi:hypothetical protein